MKLGVELGTDLSAYAYLVMEVPDGTTEKELAAMLHNRFVNDDPEVCELVFDENWGTASSMRIVQAKDEHGNFISQGYPLDPCPYDAGLEVQRWLKGMGAVNLPSNLQSVIAAAAKAGLIAQPVMEIHSGTFTLPGMESIEVEFEARVGATREEKDLAFLNALAQVARVDYLAIGQIEKKES